MTIGGRTSVWRAIALAGSAVATQGCDLILGLDQFADGGRAPTPSVSAVTGTGGAASGEGGGGSGGCAGCGEGGAPLVALGEACTLDAECASGSCAADDGVCCETACDGACEGCAVEGWLGQCVPNAPAGQDPNDECSAGAGVCDGAGTCADGTHLWAHRFGADASDEGRAVAAGPNGSVIVTGAYAGTPTATWAPGACQFVASNGASDDVVVAKIGASQTCELVAQFGGAANDGGLAVASDSDESIYVAGFFDGTASFGSGHELTSIGGYSDPFVAKLDAAGATVWAHRFGGTLQDRATAIAVDDAGNVAVAGYFEGDVTSSLPIVPPPSDGGENAFVVKLSSDGVYQWLARYGNTADDQGRAVAIDPADGSVVLAGSHGPSDAFIAKYAAGGGDPLWAQHLGGSTMPNVARAVAVNAAGNIWVAGSFYGTMIDLDGTPQLVSAAGTQDAFVALLGKDDGQVLWAKSFGNDSSGPQEAKALALDASGNVLLTGQFAGILAPTALASESGYDAFVIKLAGDGTVLWADRYGANDSNVNAAGVGVAAGADGSVFVAGEFSGLVDFQAMTLDSGSSADVDVFLLKRAP